jgi:hypothetical protein
VSIQPSDLRLINAVDEHQRSWLIFEVAACGDERAGQVRVLEASVRLAGLGEDPQALRQSIADRLNALIAEHGRHAVVELLCDRQGELRLILWPAEPS